MINSLVPRKPCNSHKLRPCPLAITNGNYRCVCCCEFRRYFAIKVKYRMVRYSGSYDNVAQVSSDHSILDISKYRDTMKYRYRTFTSIAILRYIEYRTSTNLEYLTLEDWKNLGQNPARQNHYGQNPTKQNPTI